MINLPNPDYLQYVIKPYFETRFSTVERLYLPMIDRSYSARNAVPPVIWGMLWENWRPNAAEGNTVFLRAYEDRGAENYQKKIYYSGVTPDLYRCKLRDKVQRFFKRLLDPDNAARPLMDLYLNSYFDLYWDLHLGKSDKDIPDYAIRIGQLFNRCMARVEPLDKTFYENYMEVRELRGRLDAWILRCIDEISKKIESRETEGVDRTIAYYWLINARGNGAPEGFKPDVKDISFECFHNFVALNQWGNTIYNTMDRLRLDGYHPDVLDYFDDMVANEPGELFTVEVIKDFLREVAARKIRFVKLDGKPKEVPVAPGTMVKDNIGFEEA